MDFYGFYPTGGIAHNWRRYIREWRALGKPLCKALGYQLIAYDPDCLFQTPAGQQVSLPVKIVQDLNKALTEKN